MIDDVDRLLELALARGAAEVEVYAEESVTRRVKVFRGAVEELTSARRKGVGLRVFQEGAVGYAYTSDLSDDSYAETVAMALGNARVADHDPDSVLPVPRRAAGRGRRLRPRAQDGHRRRAHRPGAGRRARRPGRRPARQVGRRVGVRRRRRRGVPGQHGRRARQLPRRPVLRLRLRAGRAGRADGDGHVVHRGAQAGRPRPAGLRRRGRPAGGRPARRLQAQDDQDDRRARPVRVGLVLRRALGRPHRRGRAEGPLAVRRPRRRAGGRRASR